MLGGRDDEQGAVVLALLPDAPGAAELVAVILDRITLQRGQGDHHQLPPGLRLQVGELRGDLLLGVRRKHMGVIDHPPGEGREGRGGMGGRKRQQIDDRGQERRQQRPRLAFLPGREGDAGGVHFVAGAAGATAGAAGADE